VKAYQKVATGAQPLPAGGYFSASLSYKDRACHDGGAWHWVKAGGGDNFSKIVTFQRSIVPESSKLAKLARWRSRMGPAAA